MSDLECRMKFRFTRDEIKRIAPLLWSRPWVKLSTRERVPRLEALCILLRRLSYPNRLVDLMDIFPRHLARLSEIITVTLNEIHERFIYLRIMNPDIYTTEQLHVLADAVAAKGDVQLTTCFGFIDGTVRAISIQI